MSVRMTGTLSWRTKSSASWLAMRPAPTMPTPLTLRASERSGAPAGRLARLFTRSKAYRPARSSSVRRRSARASSSAAKPLSSEAASVMSVLRASSSNSTALTAPGALPLVLPSTIAFARAIASSQPWPRSISGRAGVTVPARTCDAQARDCSMKSAESRTTSTTPSSSAFLGESTLFWFSEFSITTVTAFDGPTRLGSNCVPPQPGTRPRNASGRPSAPALAATVR